MDYYFLVITIIDIFVLGIMCVFIRHNEALMLRQRRCFIGSFILIIAISVLELISDIVNNAPISFRWINIVTNYLGFGLTPAVPICLSFTLAKNRINKNRYRIPAVLTRNGINSQTSHIPALCSIK